MDDNHALDACIPNHAGDHIKLCVWENFDAGMIGDDDVRFTVNQNFQLKIGEESQPLGWLLDRMGSLHKDGYYYPAHLKILAVSNLRNSFENAKGHWYRSLSSDMELDGQGLVMSTDFADVMWDMRQH